MKPKLIPKDPGDKEKAEVMQKFFDYQYDIYGGVIEALLSLKIATEAMYHIQLPPTWGDRVMQEVLKIERNK